MQKFTKLWNVWLVQRPLEYKNKFFFEIKFLRLAGFYQKAAAVKSQALKSLLAQTSKRRR